MCICVRVHIEYLSVTCGHTVERRRVKRGYSGFEVPALVRAATRARTYAPGIVAIEGVFMMKCGFTL
jgi:hypothetical protein